jgi:hypothetical protein
MPKSASITQKSVTDVHRNSDFQYVCLPPYSLLFEKKARFPRTIEATGTDFNALRPTENKSPSVILCDQSAGGQEHDSPAHC